MTAAKSNAQRQAARTAALKAQGLKRYHNFWGWPEHEATVKAFAEDEPAIKGYAAKLQRRREKGKK